MLIPNRDLDLWNSDPRIHFWANLDRKSQKCPFCLKIGTQSISTMLILIPTLAFSVSNPKSIFGQICVEKFKVVHFHWKLAHMVYRGCWFLFRHYFSEFPTLNRFLGKFELKKSKLFVFPENWHTQYLKDADSYLYISFLKIFWNFKPKSIFLANLSRKTFHISHFTFPRSRYAEYLEDVIVRIQS